MTKVRFSRFLSVFLLLGSLVACDAAENGVTQLPATTVPPTATTDSAAVAPTAELTPTETSSISYPLTIKDSLGREVTLQAAPSRIVSLAPSNTEILFAVGAGDALVGVTKYCNYPEAAKSIDQIGGFSAKTISLETIVALKPDVVFSGDESQQIVIDALTQANIPVIAIKAETFEAVYQNINLIGQATNHPTEAAQVVAEMQARIDAVTAKTSTLAAADKLSVFYEVYDEPLMTAGPQTFIGQMLELAGATNIFADVSEEYPEISAEEVVNRQPAVIIGPESHGDKLTIDLIAQRPGWGAIKAVKEGKIVVLNGDMLSRPGPRLADALEALSQALYPELFN
ncbi:MAG TPA: cobalamin-binding protein [Herpetosiphon sp.]|uniref:Periplasmic binding protein n=1 Tax=Herpetosiphon aurantiacus (strain ATCC 23779 / DSM 785 / 114-95) TaxID=316274 RepID=A9AZZ7_HERA2|nr:cobalamin-binding protein [Herpetosiphon sp.]ABX03704.1 periplasmic binding protein [Herpetosiphon aurantiacus DSM 785]HBW51515.1 cobalamin-binding protein [Herpetosiphon sp.]